MFVLKIKFAAAQGMFLLFVFLLHENSMKNTKSLLTIKLFFFIAIQKKEYLSFGGAVDCTGISKSMCRNNFSLKEKQCILYK